MKQVLLKRSQAEREKEVLSILMMRFGLNPYVAIPAAKRWLEKNRDKNWADLEEMLREGKLTFKKGKIKEVKVQDLVKVVSLIRSETGGIEIKNRWHNFRLYKNSFVGSELVEWLTERAKMSRQEAIRFGKMLVDRGIIHHVHDEHHFEDKELYYRFYQDETEACKDITENCREKAKIAPKSFDRGFDWGDILPIG